MPSWSIVPLVVEARPPISEAGRAAAGVSSKTVPSLEAPPDGRAVEVAAAVHDQAGHPDLHRWCR